MTIRRNGLCMHISCVGRDVNIDDAAFGNKKEVIVVDRRKDAAFLENKGLCLWRGSFCLELTNVVFASLSAVVPVSEVN